jgi:hypothetical protein
LKVGDETNISIQGRVTTCLVAIIGCTAAMGLHWIIFFLFLFVFVFFFKKKILTNNPKQKTLIKITYTIT